MPALVVSYAGLLGGAERILLELAGGPAEPPLIACPPGPLADAARARGLGVFELRERSLELRRSPAERVAAPARLLSLAAELRPLVAAVRPDVLVAWNMRALLALAAAFPSGSRPRLVFQHNDLLPGALIGRAVERAAKQADRVIALSHCSAQELGAGAVDVLHPGVDLERFRPDPQIERHPRRVLLLGALERWKRPDLALEAVALAARELPDLELHVAGEPLGDADPLPRPAAPAGGGAGSPGPGHLRRAPSGSRAGAARGGLPAALRRARALRAGGGRGARLRHAGGGARFLRPGRDRRPGLRAALPARRRAAPRPTRSSRCCATRARAAGAGAAGRARAERELDVRATRRALGRAGERDRPRSGREPEPGSPWSRCCTTRAPS